MDGKEIEDKLKKLDLLLENDLNMTNYIQEVEEQNIEVSSNLNSKILEKIKEKQLFEDKKINKFKPKINYFNILKIVACTMFSIILWETVLSKNVSYASVDVKPEKQINSFYSKIDEKVKVISEFFLGPINIEGRE